MSCVKKDLSVIYHRSRIGCIFGLNKRHIQIAVENPPIKIEEFSVTSPEKEIELVFPRDTRTDRSLDHHIAVVNLHACYRFSAHLVEVELDHAFALEVQHLKGYKFRFLFPEIHLTQLYPVAVMDGCHIMALSRQPVEFNAPG